VLFDLKGRRRRVVQVTYLLLAFLMGGGLVLTGIGSDAPGGLLDAILDRNSTSSNSLVEDRIDDNEKKLEENPKDKAALKALVRDWYQLANDEANPNTNQYSDEGKERLGNADDAWKRYLEVEKKRVDPSLAALMIQVYGPLGLNQAADAAKAAEAITAAQPKNAQAFLQLTQFAAQAGQKRKADLAGQRAIDLAPKNQRSTVKALVEQAKQPEPSTPPPSE
jgi:uncharacterized protein HemY